MRNKNTIERITLSPEKAVRFGRTSDRDLKAHLTKFITSFSGYKKASFFTSLLKNASLTVEAAVVLPVFLLCMLAVMQFINVYSAAVKFSCVLTETAEEMAIASYTKTYASDESPLPVVLSAAYAAGKVHTKAGNESSIKNENLLLSSFLEEDDRIDLIMTYQPRNIAGVVKIPNMFFIQRALVRGWTGRNGSEGTKTERDTDDTAHQTVYVAENGQVYHTNRNCTHIKLAVRSISRSELAGSRNIYGDKYHSCEKCGKGASDTIYITTDGRKYHSSLDCSGLKRTIHEEHLDDLDGMRPCSKCAGKEGM